MKCPACGIGTLEEKDDVIFVKKYGKEASARTKMMECPVCGSSFPAPEDKALASRLARNLELGHCRAQLTKLESAGFANIERVCGLPQRTLSKWKQGKQHPSAAGIVLVNLLATVPWLLTVIDMQYDPACVISLELHDIEKKKGEISHHHFLLPEKNRLVNVSVYDAEQPDADKAMALAREWA